MDGGEDAVELLDWSEATLGGALTVLLARVSCAGAEGACAGAAAACAGAAAACADAADACAGAGAGSAGVGCAAMVAESAVDEVAAGSLDTLRSSRVDAAALFVERDDWLEAFTLEVLALEGLVPEAGAVSISFTGLRDFTGGVAGDDDSRGTFDVLDSLLACATVVPGPLAELVSLTLGAVDATFVALVAGCAMTSWPTLRSNANAPAITTATITPKAIPKCLTRFSLRGV